MVVEALVTFVIILAGIWFVTEVLQGVWYEKVVSYLTPRAFVAAAVLTALQLYLGIRLESLVSDSLPWAIVSGIVWAVVFYALFEFSAGHALGLGLAAMLLLTSLSGLASDGFRGVGAGPARPARTTRAATKPNRSARVGSGFMPFQQPSIESRGPVPAKSQFPEPVPPEEPTSKQDVPSNMP